MWLLKLNVFLFYFGDLDIQLIWFWSSYDKMTIKNQILTEDYNVAFIYGIFMNL